MCIRDRFGTAVGGSVTDSWSTPQLLSRYGQDGSTTAVKVVKGAAVVVSQKSISTSTSSSAARLIYTTFTDLPGSAFCRASFTGEFDTSSMKPGDTLRVKMWVNNSSRTWDIEFEDLDISGESGSVYVSGATRSFSSLNMTNVEGLSSNVTSIVSAEFAVVQSSTTACSAWSWIIRKSGGTHTPTGTYSNLVLSIIAIEL